MEEEKRVAERRPSGGRQHPWSLPCTQTPILHIIHQPRHHLSTSQGHLQRGSEKAVRQWSDRPADSWPSQDVCCNQPHPSLCSQPWGRWRKRESWPCPLQAPRQPKNARLTLQSAECTLCKARHRPRKGQLPRGLPGAGPQLPVSREGCTHQDGAVAPPVHTCGLSGPGHTTMNLGSCLPGPDVVARRDAPRPSPSPLTGTWVISALSLVLSLGPWTGYATQCALISHQ